MLWSLSGFPLPVSRMVTGYSRNPGRELSSSLTLLLSATTAHSRQGSSPRRGGDTAWWLRRRACGDRARPLRLRGGDAQNPAVGAFAKPLDRPWASTMAVRPIGAGHLLEAEWEILASMAAVSRLADIGTRSGSAIRAYVSVRCRHADGAVCLWCT